MPVGEKKVGLPELFYDLVFVYALSRTTELVHHADEADYVTFLISLVILFTVWSYQIIYINRFSDNSWRDRLFLFADMFLLLFLSNAMGSDWLANFVPFNLALGLLVGSVCLQYLLQFARHASPKQRRRIKLVAGLRGLTAAMVLGSLLFPAHIRQWVALGGFGLGWILPTFVSHKQPAVNFPHLLERLNGLVIIFFGETVIDIAPYFHVAKFEIGALPVIVILFAMFTVYVMQFSYFINEHKAQNSGALPSYSHYAVLIGIALVTVALAWLHQNSTATAESVRMLWLGLGVFYLGVAANTPYNKPEHRRPQRLWIFQTTLFVIGAGLTAVLPPQPLVILTTTALMTAAIAMATVYFERRTRQLSQTNQNYET